MMCRPTSGPGVGRIKHHHLPAYHLMLQREHDKKLYADLTGGQIRIVPTTCRSMGLSSSNALVLGAEG